MKKEEILSRPLSSSPVSRLENNVVGGVAGMRKNAYLCGRFQGRLATNFLLVLFCDMIVETSMAA